MTTQAKLKDADVPFGLTKPDPYSPVFEVTGRTDIAIKGGTEISRGGIVSTVGAGLGVLLDSPQAGTDYVVWIGSDGDAVLRAVAWPHGITPDQGDYIDIGGFHFAAGGNAIGTEGGDDIPAINPNSCWDRNFRPRCDDVRGMTLVDDGRLRPFWVDIYLTGCPTETDACTSRFGVTIADGKSLSRFDFSSAEKVMASQGKQLLGAEEFFVMAYGVTERSAAPADPKVTGLDAERTSRWGVMQATGNMWIWGTDGHPDEPRASIFGGSWICGSYAGSRFAYLVCWPGDSVDYVGARGRSDHLVLV